MAKLVKFTDGRQAFVSDIDLVGLLLLLCGKQTAKSVKPDIILGLCAKGFTVTLADWGGHPARWPLLHDFEFVDSAVDTAIPTAQPCS